MPTHPILVVLLASVLCSGCGTIAAHKYKNSEMEGVYQGVRLDCDIFPGGDAYPFPLVVFDLPLSLVADTLVLPYDIIHSAKKKEEPAPLDR